METRNTDTMQKENPWDFVQDQLNALRLKFHKASQTEDLAKVDALLQQCTDVTVGILRKNVGLVGKKETVAVNEGDKPEAKGELGSAMQHIRGAQIPEADLEITTRDVERKINAVNKTNEEIYASLLSTLKDYMEQQLLKSPKSPKSPPKSPKLAKSPKSPRFSLFSKKDTAEKTSLISELETLIKAVEVKYEATHRSVTESNRERSNAAWQRP